MQLLMDRNDTNNNRGRVTGSYSPPEVRIMSTKTRLNQEKKINIRASGYLITASLCILLMGACKKSKDNPVGCGCENGKLKGRVTYNNFGGHDYNAWLIYAKEYNQNAWFLSVEIPNSNFGAICKICNPNLPAIKNYTDTSSKERGIPVKVAGTVRDLCEGEGFGFTLLPETLVAYITIDSLTKK